MNIYTKPANLKYTEMCIYIDNNIYNNTYDVDTVYQYLYFLFKALAIKAKYFHTSRNLEEFAIYGANYVFLRLTDKRQFEVDEDGKPKLSKIKSVLNYIKSIIYSLKTRYEKNEHYQEQVETDVDDIDINFKNRLRESVNSLRLSEFSLYMEDIVSVFRKKVYSLPYRNDEVAISNIYISCLLTFLNRITLSNNAKEYLANYADYMQDKPYIIERLYEQERKDSVILYHLDDDMRDYIDIVVKEISHMIFDDMSSILSEDPIGSECMHQNDVGIYYESELMRDE